MSLDKKFPNDKKGSEFAILQNEVMFFHFLKQKINKNINCNNINCSSIEKIELDIGKIFDKYTVKYMTTK